MGTGRRDEGEIPGIVYYLKQVSFFYICPFLTHGFYDNVMHDCGSSVNCMIKQEMI